MRVWPIVLTAILGCAAQQPDVHHLSAPLGFQVSVFADSGVQARMLAFSPGGTLLVTAINDGKVVALPDPQHTGKAERVVTVLADLNGPHGIKFYEGKLYVAEVDKIVRYDWDEKALRASNPHAVASGLPGGMHLARPIVFANGKLYVGVGSDCNVCVEPDKRQATVMEMNTDGSGLRVFGSGLRSVVGLALNPKTKTVWATENGRDWLGDDLPPDEINDLGATGGDFGWPYCYGNRVADAKFSKSAAERCGNTVPPMVELQAHSAPLGLEFESGTNFPGEYKGALFVAYHGSWNRSVPTGYKVVWIKIDGAGHVAGKPEDFITGWMPPGARRFATPMGRPVGIAFGPDGAMYIADDAKGMIYRVTYGR